MIVEEGAAVDAPDGTNGVQKMPAMIARHVWIPLGIYVLVRILDTLFLAWASNAQVAGASLIHLGPIQYFVFEPRPADPGVLGVSTNWDGEWYRLIATQGYGHPGAYAGDLGDYVRDRSWTFPPMFPVLVGLVMSATGLAFAPAAAALNVIIGAVAILLIHRLTLPYVGEVGAAGAVALTCCWVTSPVLQLAYSEALALALLAAILLALDRRHPWVAAALVILLALTRLVTPAIALVALACYLAVWRRDRRSLARWEVLGVLAVVLASTVGVFIWSTIVTTLGPASIEDRALSMTTSYSGGWFGQFWRIHPAAALIPLVLCAFAVRVGWSERRAWGVASSSWVAAYAVTLIVLTPLHIGIVRYSLLAFPLSLVAAGRPGQPVRWRVLAIATACVVLLVLQALWIRYALIVDDSAGNVLSP